MKGRAGGRALLVVLCAVAVLAGLAGCGGEPTEPPVVLDGSPRPADDEGVVTALDVDARSLTLDEDRSYQVSEELRSFSALDLSIQPLAAVDGSYVQVGLDGQVIIWIGRIANVVPVDPPRVFYIGRLARVEPGDGDSRRVVFREGAVFALADGVEPPPASEGEVLQAEIDPAIHAVVALRPA